MYWLEWQRIDDERMRKEISVRWGRARCSPLRRNIILLLLLFLRRVCFWREFVDVAVHWENGASYKWHTRGKEPPLLLLLLFFSLLLFYCERSLFCSVCVCFCSFFPFFFFHFVHFFVGYGFERIVGSLFLLREHFSQTTLLACLRSFDAKREKGLCVCMSVTFFPFFFFFFSFVRGMSVVWSRSEARRWWRWQNGICRTRNNDDADDDEMAKTQRPHSEMVNDVHIPAKRNDIHIARAMGAQRVRKCWWNEFDNWVDRVLLVSFRFVRFVSFVVAVSILCHSGQCYACFVRVYSAFPKWYGTMWRKHFAWKMLSPQWCGAKIYIYIFQAKWWRGRGKRQWIANYERVRVWARRWVFFTPATFIRITTPCVRCCSVCWCFFFFFVFPVHSGSFVEWIYYVAFLFISIFFGIGVFDDVLGRTKNRDASHQFSGNAPSISPSPSCSKVKYKFRPCARPCSSIREFGFEAGLGIGIQPAKFWSVHWFCIGFFSVGVVGHWWLASMLNLNC